jgi:tRNA(Ile)-lysidine synthase
MVMASRLAQLVLEDLERLAGARPRVMVAFSGGVDSTVLAHILQKQRRKLGGLRLVHVDHGLQSVSRDWSRHCEAQARAWKVEFTSLAAKLTIRRGESPEAAARDARYALLARELRAGEVLVTAQHQDDQVETLLL